MTMSILLLLLAIISFAFGTWGRRHAATLVSRSLPDKGKHSREKSLRRGSAAFRITGVLWFLLAIVHVMMYY
ncbi:hypothetical protein SAMN06265360_113124 [Haloechinothrix alba]|uniref:Uncharacterized protein n=1 Tax=Haloechinothrix alba TaxID=664784 RepID=A0A238Y5G6_9PSEU|nr:hypothetical protein [Haloechinothrix alba]SNR66068.1 hypothetical protein SAMN06265360_113124 [Haloechinothrix alba]